MNLKTRKKLKVGNTQPFIQRMYLGTIHLRRRHFLGGGVKNLPNLPMDSSKVCII